MDPHELKSEYSAIEAEEYETKRTNSEQWKREQKTVTDLLTDLQKNENVESVLDLPVGTGRFLPLYRELSLDVLGIDASSDMLKQAEKKTSNRNTIELREDDVFSVEGNEINQDVWICMRFVNWLDEDAFIDFLNKIGEVNTDFVVIGVRTKDKENRDYDKRAAIAMRSRKLIHLFRKSIRIMLERGPVTLIRVGKKYINDKIRGRRKTTVHDEDTLRKYVSKINYSIEKQEKVDKKNSTQYHIYLLENKDK